MFLEIASYTQKWDKTWTQLLKEEVLKWKVIKYWTNPTMFLLFLSLLVWKTVVQSAKSSTGPARSAFKPMVRSYLFKRTDVEEKSQSGNRLYPLTWCSHKNDKYGSSAYQERCSHYIGKCWCHHLTSKTYFKKWVQSHSRKANSAHNRYGKGPFEPYWSVSGLKEVV